MVNSGLAPLGNATLRPNTAPAGSNDWSCAPPPEHPHPVVLVHGTVEGMSFNRFSPSPRLALRGLLRATGQPTTNNGREGSGLTATTAFRLGTRA